MYYVYILFCICDFIKLVSVVKLQYFLRSVPVSWRSDFVSESKEAESKIASLKSRIQTSGVKVTEK